jgi:putative transposase
MTGLKKNMNLSVNEKRMLIEKDHKILSIADQCLLLELPRSSYYYEATNESLINIELMHQIDQLYTKWPFYGSRRMTHVLCEEGYNVNRKRISRLMRLMGLVNRKRISRLMRLMGLEAIYPKPNLSKSHPSHHKYPYLLRGLLIERPNQVWSTDITYVRLQGGFAYLVAVIDWYSRYVLSWELSNSLDTNFCLIALEKALSQQTPEIFNTDQGVQFTSNDFISILKSHLIAISMDGRGRALDNIFVERLWRSVKYEDIYIKGYETMSEAYQGLSAYFDFYNNTRPHQSLDYRTPSKVYYETNLHLAV